MATPIPPELVASTPSNSRPSTPSLSRASTPGAGRLSKKTPDWSTYEINEKKWLPLDANLQSVSTIIANLGLRHVNISADQRALDIVEPDSIIGYICTSNGDIEFGEKTDYHEQWSLIPVKIQNSALTISLLNLCAVNGKYRNITYGYMIEKYIRDAVMENSTITTSVFAVTPVPFAHNVAAKNFPLKEPNQRVYVFVQLGNILALIGEDGHLYCIQQSDLSGKEFMKFAQDNWNCDVFVVVEDPFRDLQRALDDTKSELAALIGDEEANKSNAHLDASLTYEELKEISALNEQIEEIEDFPLMIDYGSNTVTTEPARPSTSKNDRIHALEQQILDMRKHIEDTRKIFPHIFWPAISDIDLYGSKEYLKFYTHYKKVIHVATPKLLKPYMFAPIRTPKTPATGQSTTTRRKRKADPTTSSLVEAVAPSATPKRTRPERAALREQNKTR